MCKISARFLKDFRLDLLSKISALRKTCWLALTHHTACRPRFFLLENVRGCIQYPLGGKQVLQGCDHGVPLANTAAKNPLRKELMKLAQSLHALGQDDAKAA